ncbi:unnamed protein product [Staurois parvus]|uniref:HMG box domain-containing protein n=1 Tax=Staurois parvus TaxID=386267 RepID=A0ABN9D1J2_9NEOB|nr:unnamed protein product [Staurois parvus]
MSAYMLWLNASREKIKGDNPGISITDLSKKAGEIWKGMSKEKEWDRKAEEAKRDYEKAMKEYNKNAPPSEVSKKVRCICFFEVTIALFLPSDLLSLTCFFNKGEEAKKREKDAWED